jgi:hypothetical protein
MYTVFILQISTPEFYNLLGYNAVKSTESQQTFRRTCRLYQQGRRINQEINQCASRCLVSRLAYFSNLKIGGGGCSSDTSADFQRNTRSYIPEDSTLPKSRCVNLKSYLGQNLEPKHFIITGSLCFNTRQQILVIAKCEFGLFRSDYGVFSFISFK